MQRPQKTCPHFVRCGLSKSIKQTLHIRLASGLVINASHEDDGPQHAGDGGGKLFVARVFVGVWKGSIPERSLRPFRVSG